MVVTRRRTASSEDSKSSTRKTIKHVQSSCSDKSESSEESLCSTSDDIPQGDKMVLKMLPLLHRDDKEICMFLTHRIPFVYITGPPNSGKSYCLDHAVAKVRITHKKDMLAVVDMRDVLKVQGFYQTVLSQLSSHVIPDHISDFVRQLHDILDEKSCVLVIKHAQLLNELNSMLFASVSLLHQLTNGKVSVVMVSDTPWELVYHANGSTLTPPLILHVPPYTRIQMVDIISQYLLNKHSTLCAELDIALEELKKFVRTCIYDSLTLYTSSIRELMSTASTLLPKYLEPIRDKSLTKSDDIKLFHRIQKILVSTMSQLSCVPKFSSLDLPYNMRVILVCTFLASHNPARLDKRFFCKGKSSRRKVKSRPGSKVNEAMKGPKSFPLDRLVAIYSSITQSGAIPCSDIMSAVSTLVSLSLVVRVSLDLLEQPKFKCLVPLTTVHTLAKESGIDFEQFYYNY